MQAHIIKQNTQLPQKLSISRNNKSSYIASISFKGQAEIGATKKIVKAHSLVAAGLNTMAAPPFDNLEAAFLANYLAMAKQIADIYKLKIEQKVMISTIDGLAAKLNRIVAAHKLLTWIPIVGGQINGLIPYSKTYSIGHEFMQLCEKGTLK